MAKIPNPTKVEAEALNNELADIDLESLLDEAEDDQDGTRILQTIQFLNHTIGFLLDVYVEVEK